MALGAWTVAVAIFLIFPHRARAECLANISDALEQSTRFKEAHCQSALHHSGKHCSDSSAQ